MAKLSTQLQEAEPIGRVSRTQRQLEQQERATGTQRFQDLQTEAQEIQKTRLSNLNSIDEYESEYNKLRPEIQQFFSSPQQLRQARTQRIEGSKTEILKKIEQTQEKQKQAETSFEKSKSEIPKLDPRERTAFKRDITEDFREQNIFLSEKLSGLQEGLNRLGAGEDLRVGDIERFAKSKGAVAEEKEMRISKKQPTLKKKIITINATKFLEEKLRGLKKKGETKTVRDVAGGFSEVSLFEKGQEKVQIVRSKETGEVTVIDTGGKDKGEFIKFTGTSDKEIELEQKRIQEEAIKTFEEARKQKPFFIDFDKIERGQVPRRETISTEPRADFIPIQIDQGKESIIGKAFGVINKGLAKTGDVRIFSPFETFGVGGTKVKDIKEFLEPKISKKKQELFFRELEETGIKTQLETQSQEEFQTRFEDKFFKEIIRGEISFEKAEEEFKESREAKIVGIKFEKGVKERRKELLGGKFTKEGFALVGLSTAELGLKVIPETIGGAVLTTGAVVGGVKLISLIPPTASTITTGVIGGIGTLEAISPTALPEEKAGGVITAGISLTILGIQGIKFLRRPTIKTIKITPEATLLQEQQTGLVKKTSSKIVKDLMGKATKLEKFKATRRSEQIISGRRTVISTKFKELLGLDPVFKGVPFTTKGRVGFTKALKILEKRLGLTEAQARSILRFRQPKIILSKFEADILIKSGDLFEKPLIALKGTRDITQPVVTIRKSLGLKTRGATQIREFITGRGAIVGTAPTGEEILKLTFDIEKTFVTPTGAIFQKLTQAGKTTKQIQQFTFIERTGEDVIKVQRRLAGIVVKTDKFPLDIFTERSIAKQIIPKGEIFVGKGRTAVIRTDLIPEEIDLRKLTGINIKELRSTIPIKEIKELRIIKDQINLITKKTVSTPSPTGVSAKTIQKTIKQATDLKAVLEPKVSAVKLRIKDILGIGTKADTLSTTLSKVGLISGVIAKTSTKTDQGILQKSALDQKTFLKSLIMENTLEKEALKSTSGLLSGQSQALTQKQILDLDTTLISAPFIPRVPPSFPVFKIPTIPTITIPFSFPTAKASIKQKQKDKKLMKELLLLPDFTSQALGLEPERLSERQAVKKLKKIMTGLEIRRGVSISKLPQ